MKFVLGIVFDLLYWAVTSLTDSFEDEHASQHTVVPPKGRKSTDPLSGEQDRGSNG